MLAYVVASTVAPTATHMLALGQLTPLRLAARPLVPLDQLAPPSVLVSTPCMLPTMQSLVLRQAIPHRLSLVPDARLLHLVPPSVLLRMVPLVPTARHWLCVGQVAP